MAAAAAWTNRKKAKIDRIDRRTLHSHVKRQLKELDNGNYGRNGLRSRAADQRGVRVSCHGFDRRGATRSSRAWHRSAVLRRFPPGEARGSVHVPALRTATFSRRNEVRERHRLAKLHRAFRARAPRIHPRRQL